MSDWIDELSRDVLRTCGRWTSGGPEKGVLHSTEGGSYAGARAAYVANGSNPHVTLSWENGRPQGWQHTPLDRASCALRNAAGGVQTGRDGAIQIELVGTADKRMARRLLYVEDFPVDYLDWIALIMRRIETATGIPARSPAMVAYPGSYGLRAPQRMSGHAWNAWRGWCGHQHVPENTHGDPGLLAIDYLLGRAAEPTTTSEEDIMRRGDRGAEVTVLQWRLAAVGQDPGPADGQFGPATAAAVKAYQASHGYTQTGVADLPTYLRISEQVTAAQLRRAISRVQVAAGGIERDQVIDILDAELDALKVVRT